MEHFITDLITESNTKNPTNQIVVQKRSIFFTAKYIGGRAPSYSTLKGSAGAVYKG